MPAEILDLERAPGPDVDDMGRPIGGVAEVLGVSVGTLRYDEKAGLPDTPVRDVAARIATLTDCLALVDYKIVNYERLEAGLAPLATRAPGPSHEALPA